MVIYDVPIYKSILRTFSEDGKPYPIIDDDLDEVLSKSDFAKPRRNRLA
jgi:hypothetical protein